MKIFECSIPVNTDNGITQGVVIESAYVVAYDHRQAMAFFWRYAQKEYEVAGISRVREVIPESDIPDDLLRVGQIFPMWLLEALWQDAVALRGDDYEAWKEQEIIEDSE